ncbi:MAG TPA: hypothetical protein VGE52_14685, partial [Pirellulales bacterium]
CRAWSRYPDAPAGDLDECPQCRTRFHRRGTRPAEAAPPAAPSESSEPCESPRRRRLAADAERMRRAFADGAAIRATPRGGSPPEAYRLEYRIQGVEPGENGVPRRRDRHLVELRLGPDYPWVGPTVRVLTPVFHPALETGREFGIAGWTAAARLTEIVGRLGGLLAYQLADAGPPRNAEAARWASRFRDRLPLDRRDFLPPLKTDAAS